jgi:ATP-dependent Clp protease ATP-binding subunit ClpA
MFDRFTDRARKVMALARKEAQRFNHDFIGTEHILLGLIGEGSGVAANVLKNLGVEINKIRSEIEKNVQPGPSAVTMGQLPFTPRAKKVLELTMEEANELGYSYIGTEHLLLGMLRERDGVAAQVLLDLGLKLEDVRSEVLALLGAEATPLEDAGDFRRRAEAASERIYFPPVRERLSPFAEASREAIRRAGKEAEALGHDRVAPIHLLLGLFANPAGEASSLLRSRGLTPEKVREEAFSRIGPGRRPGILGRIGRILRGRPVSLDEGTAAVLGRAGEEALDLGARSIGNLHILLGILELGDDPAVRILRHAGIDIPSLQDEAVDMVLLARLDPAARKAVGLAREEAKALGHDSVGTEHMVLGLLLEGTGIAEKALRAVGVDPDPRRPSGEGFGGGTRLRAEIEKLFPRLPAAAAGRRPPFTTAARMALGEARKEARDRGLASVDTGHLLLGVLRAESGAGSRLPALLGTSVEAVRQEVLKLLPERKSPRPAKPKPKLLPPTQVGNIEIVDDDGRSHARIDLGFDGSPYLEMLDAVGRVRLVLGLDASGAPSLHFRDADGKPVLDLPASGPSVPPGSPAPPGATSSGS